MLPVKVRKSDKELNVLAPSIRVIVDLVEKIIAENLGNEFKVNHKINLYTGEKQRFANNPRSQKMYIQYDSNIEIDLDPNSTVQNLYIIGVLHEIGHSYLKIENSLRRAKESIISEGIAHIFAFIFIDAASTILDKNSFLIKNNFLGREKQWLNDVIKGTREVPYPLEITRFFSKLMDKEKLYTMIKAFNLKHKTVKEFEDIVEEIFGKDIRNEYVKIFNSFDFEKYGKSYNRKV